MKKCTLSDILFYAMDGQNATYVIMRFELDQAVRRKEMSEAFSRACGRFPYFQTKLKNLEPGFELVPNENTPVMHEDTLDYVINASENDDFLYRFSALGNTLTFSMFHGLTDAAGIINFMKVLLTEYYKSLGEEVLPPEDIYDVNGTPDPEETEDPLDRIPDVEPTQDYGDRSFRIPGKPTKDAFSYTFSANAEKILQYGTAVGGTPNTVFAVVAAKAIRDIYPESMKDGIDIDIAINSKQVIGISRSHMPFIETSKFHYDDVKLNMDERELHPDVHAKLMDDCTVETLYPALAGVRILGSIFEYISNERARKLLCFKSTETARATATVSYVGATDFGSVGKHITGIYTFGDACAPLLEINFNEDTFYFSMSAQKDPKKLMERIRERFIDMGFECSDLRSVRFELSKGKKDRPRLGPNLTTLRLISGIRAYGKEAGSGQKK